MINASWLAKKSTDLKLAGSTPADFMNASARPISLAICSYRSPTLESRINPLFHSWTWRRSAKPPWVNARTKLRVAAEVLYTRTNRCGSGVRDASLNSMSLTASPRYAGSVTSPRVSKSLERGFANCPAMRPTLITGKLE